MTDARVRCLIVDDEHLGRELIEGHVAQLQQLQLVASCANALEADETLASESVDLLFLDIEMPMLKGTDFYQGLRHPPAVIFTTAYREYALEGFELEAIDYLLKPVTFPRFFKAVNRFLNARRARATTDELPRGLARDFVFVRCDRKDVRLCIADIEYVQGLKDYIRIHTQRKIYTVKETMQSFSERAGSELVRVHRSYLVNRLRVTALASMDVEVGDIEIPLGETYRAEALRKLGDS